MRILFRECPGGADERWTFTKDVRAGEVGREALRRFYQETLCCCADFVDGLDYVIASLDVRLHGGAPSDVMKACALGGYAAEK